MRQLVKMWSILFIFLYGFYFATTQGIAAQKALDKTPHKIPEFNGKIKIDGVLDDKKWQDALVFNLEYEVEPGENIKAPVKTKVYMIYNKSHLYVGFQAYDPKPAEIRAHVTDRDNIWNDDYVGIALDTFNDSRRCYNFYCNPLGIQAESTRATIGGESQWDAIWKSSGSINKEGYAVEMAIPFNSLRFQGKKGDQIWGVDAMRNYPRSLNHFIGLFPRDRNNNCYMCQSEKLIGFSGVKPGKNIELDPTLSGIFTQEREGFTEGKFVDKTKELDPGISMHWGITPNMTLSAAVNPDFSHIEADAAMLDVNKQFALYYPERRPFFLEGASLFRSRMYAIYTRTIADPYWGVKLTGKEGPNAIGFYTVQDSITNLIFPGSHYSSSTSLNMSNLSTVFRYRRDISRSSNVGCIITDREGDDYYNRVAALDADLRITSKDRIMTQFIGSQTRYPEQVALDFNQSLEKITGSAFNFFYFHDTKTWSWFGEYFSYTPGFRADLGYIPQADAKRYYVGGWRSWYRNPGHWFTMLRLVASYKEDRDFRKNVIEKGYLCDLNYRGPLQSFLNIYAHLGTRGYLGREYDYNRATFDFGFRPSGSLFFMVYGEIGDNIDYYNVQSASQLRLNPMLEFNIGRRLVLSLDHAYEKFNVDGGRLYTANLTNLRFVYQFNRRTFLRTIFQYTDYSYNPSLYSFPVDPKYKHLFTQILFSYKINPQTVLFLGYSDDYYGDKLTPIIQSNRTLFLKIGYALVL